MEQKFKSILKKVTALYLSYGIHSVTMDDVARELGISKKTLYKFVKDKEELVEKVMNYLSRSRAELFISKASSKMNAIEEIFFVNRIVHRIIKDSNIVMDHDLQKYYPRIFEKEFRKRQERMYKSMLNNLKKGKQEGLYRAELNEEIIAKTYLHRMSNVQAEKVVSVKEFTSQAFIDELYLYHIRGVASKKGLEFLEKNQGKLFNPGKE